MYGRKYMGIERTTVIVGRNGRIVADPPRAAIEQAEAIIHHNDAPILAAARLADVDYLVTWNTRHFHTGRIPRSIPANHPQRIMSFFRLMKRLAQGARDTVRRISMDVVRHFAAWPAGKVRDRVTHRASKNGSQIDEPGRKAVHDDRILLLP